MNIMNIKQDPHTGKLLVQIDAQECCENWSEIEYCKEISDFTAQRIAADLFDLQNRHNKLGVVVGKQHELICALVLMVESLTFLATDFADSAQHVAQYQKEMREKLEAYKKTLNTKD